MLSANDEGALARRTVLFCALAAVCEGFDLQAAGVAAAGIRAQFHPTADQLGTFFSASTLGLFFGALIGGRLADSLGRKAVLVTSVGLFGLFSLLTPLAWDMSSLSYARLLTGLGLGGALPNLIALAAESSGENRRNANVALVYAGNPLGGALVSLISFALVGVQWRVIFVVGGLIPLLLAPIMAFNIRESAAFRNRTDRSVGSIAGIFQSGRASATLVLWVSFFLGLLLLYLFLSWLPTLLVGNGLTRSQAAAAQVGFNIGGVIAALITGVLMEGSRRNSCVTAIYIALPLLLVALAHFPPQMPIVFTMVFLLGCAVIAAQAFLYAVAPELYPIAVRGIGVGAAVAAGRLGSIVGPKLGGLLQSAGHGYSQVLMDLLPIVIVCSLSALLLAWLTSRRARPVNLPH